MNSERALFDLIETVYLCASGAADWQIFLDQFCAQFPALKPALTGYDHKLKDVKLSYAAASNMDPHFVDTFKTHYYKINPWRELVLDSPLAPNVAWAHEVVPLEQLQKTEFYADWVKPQGNVATGFTTMLVKGKDRSINLSVNVNPKHIREAQAAAEAMAVIGPHLRRGLDLHHQLMGQRILKSSYQSVLNMLPTAVFLVDANGKIKFSNVIGERLLSEERIAKGSATGCLCFIDAHDHREVTDSIQCANMRIGPQGREIIPLHATPSGRHFAFVTPLSMEPCASIAHRSACLLIDLPIAVFVIDSKELPRAKFETIAAALNVTPAEARLAAAMLHDKPLKQYADENGISFHTARAQMRSLLEKTDTHRQSSLVLLLTKVFSTLNLS